MTSPTNTATGPTVTATASGTFGELLQGMLPEGREFLVTLPITVGAHATLNVDPGLDGVRVFPGDRTKSGELVHRVLERLRPGWGAELWLAGDLPLGKGLASSSADLVATARTLCRALELPEDPGVIASWLREIEPTDGVMYPGAVAFYHREVRLRESFGQLPPLSVIAVDEGGTVDSVGYNSRPKSYTEQQRHWFAELLRAMGKAIRDADCAAIGTIATESATLNQQINPKRTLAELIGVCAAIGGAGVAVAHSGTTVGILISRDDPAYVDKVAQTRAHCERLSLDVSVYHSEPRQSIPSEGTHRVLHEPARLDRWNSTGRVAA